MKNFTNTKELIQSDLSLKISKLRKNISVNENVIKKHGILNTGHLIPENLSASIQINNLSGITLLVEQARSEKELIDSLELHKQKLIRKTLSANFTSSENYIQLRRETIEHNERIKSLELLNDYLKQINEGL